MEELGELIAQKRHDYFIEVAACLLPLPPFCCLSPFPSPLSSKKLFLVYRHWNDPKHVPVHEKLAI